MMRILLLSDAASEHTRKWALGLAGRGIEVGLFSFNYVEQHWYEGVKNIRMLYHPSSKTNPASLFTKMAYLKYVKKVRSVIRDFKPSIVHAHYATSYGLVGRLSGFHPFVISAWGTDVMRFPQQGNLNKKLLGKNFKNADVICATSSTIRSYIGEVLDKEVKVIPFGVDTQLFSRGAKKELFPEGTIVIGCIKSLENPYRIDVLIRAFAELQKETKKKLGLLIVGSGTKEQSLKELCAELEITDKVIFTGKIDHAEVQQYFSTIDVFANLSEYESFGVSVIEAMACENAVVVTDVGGLAEIVDSPLVGSRVPVDDVEATKAAINRYVQDESYRKETGKRARTKVQQVYAWDRCLDEMIRVYEGLTTPNK
jgi:glycosyltransferase involved in cell wall biosynthesis